MAEKSKMVIRWTVTHPDHATLPVVADNAELATVEAARIWGVPWTRIAFDAEAKKESEILPRVCVKCRRALYEAGEKYCPACRAAIRSDEENVRRRKARWYREQAIREKRRKEEAG